MSKQFIITLLTLAFTLLFIAALWQPNETTHYDAIIKNVDGKHSI